MRQHVSKPHVFFVLLTLCFVTAFAVQSANAQPASENIETTPQINIEEPDPAKDDLSDVPDEYIEEAWNFNQYCNAKPKLSDYQDCECLAAKYLDKRIEVGPNIDRSSIILAIDGQCPDATNAAGRQFQKCLSNGVVMPPEIKLEDFCECYANTYAKLFEFYAPRPGSKVFVRLQTQANVTCRDPALARKLYHQQVQ